MSSAWYRLRTHISRGKHSFLPLFMGDTVGLVQWLFHSHPPPSPSLPPLPLTNSDISPFFRWYRSHEADRNVRSTSLLAEAVWWVSGGVEASVNREWCIFPSSFSSCFFFYVFFLSFLDDWSSLLSNYLCACEITSSILRWPSAGIWKRWRRWRDRRASISSHSWPLRRYSFLLSFTIFPSLLFLCLRPPSLLFMSCSSILPFILHLTSLYPLSIPPPHQ